MKNMFKKYVGIALAAMVGLTACSDQFLQDLKNFDNASEAAYEYYSGSKARLSDAYQWSLPTSTGGMGWQFPSSGVADTGTQSTEEYTGFTTFTNPENDLNTVNGKGSAPDYFQGSTNNIQQSCWGRIRNINDMIRGISNSGGLTQSEKNELLGQAYFFRAWCYWMMVQWYGGVPIILEPQTPVAESITPRSSTVECMQFIFDELDRAADLLAPFTTNGGWKSADDYGRVTTGTVMAVKGRILLWWASPIFNRANDQTRWQKAYEYISASIPVINSCGYALAYEGDPGVNASNWAKMFTNIDRNPEAIFFTLYNDILKGNTPDYQRNNAIERGLRPTNTLGNGGRTPSAAIVDLFPMADGKRPSSYNSYTTLEASQYTYDPEFPIENRDPRFYRTFAFPGVRWTFNGDPRNAENTNEYNGKDYELWNYVWYETAELRDKVDGSGYGPDNLLTGVRGFYIRKKSSDFDLGSANYTDFVNSYFERCNTSHIDLRYAEVLLNLAEAAAGAGQLTVAVEQLQRIRARVGYTADNNYGLQANLTSDQAACMAAVLYERQIELAFEGKRFYDMRRWLLFDGGTGFMEIEGAPAHWQLTGWGGNTCMWLGFQPMNGQRVDNFEFRIKDDYNNGLGGVEYPNVRENGTLITANDPDPLVNVTRPAAIDLREELGPQMEALKSFYQTYLTRKKKKGDGWDSDNLEMFRLYRPRYYILGFNSGIQGSNMSLEQNIGWEDYKADAANGTFDPLAPGTVE